MQAWPKQVNKIPLKLVHLLYSYGMYLPNGKKPSCPHATFASRVSQPSSQTVPHTPYIQISTLPLVDLTTPVSLTSPWVQLEIATVTAWKKKHEVSIHCTWTKPSIVWELHNNFMLIAKALKPCKQGILHEIINMWCRVDRKVGPLYLDIWLLQENRRSCLRYANTETGISLSQHKIYHSCMLDAQVQ